MDEFPWVLPLTPRVAADIGPYLHRTLERARSEDHATFEAETWRFARNQIRLARMYFAGSAPVASATGEMDPSEIVDPVMEIDVATFSERTGRRQSSVRRSLARGTLAGRRDDRGHWWICAENVAS